jgi:tRNA(Ile)-lysidine synthase
MKPDSCAVTLAVAGFTALPAYGQAHFLIALSGGPDSVALLLAMADSMDHCRLSACWVNHGLRPERELAREQVFVESLCSRLEVPLKIVKIPRGRIAGEAGRDGGIEAAARRFRYEALESARRETASDLILTAHTADDWLETMVMRFFGGSGSAGLKGIPAVSPTVARPFLGVGKEDILAYLKERGQEYSMDSTNLGVDFLRNRVRQQLLPQVLDVFPAAFSALRTLAAKNRLDDEALESLAGGLFEDGKLPAERFFAAPLAVRIRALYRLCLKARSSGIPAGSGSIRVETPATQRLSWTFIEKAASSNQSASILGQGAGLKITVSDGYIRADKHAPSRALPAGALPRGFSMELSAPGRFRIGTVFDCRLYCSPEPDGLRLDSFEWPLVLRSRRSGDRICLPSGSRQLDRLLADLQVPVALRDMVPLVEDRTGIVAVLGSLAGFRDIYRRNDALAGQTPPGFLVLEMKGVVSDDAIQR